MNMKKIAFYAALLCIAAGLQNCALESEIYDQINAGMYPSTARDAKDMVTANAYGGFQNNGYDGAFNCATGFHLSNDIATDFGFCSWGGISWEPLEWANFTGADNRNGRQGWAYLNWISKMTLAIDRIEAIDMDADLKKQYVAELRCGRGFMAFLIWDRYGAIIVADLETLKDPLAEKVLPRLTEERTREYIETELKAAAEVLPATIAYGGADYGRFTAGLAHTLLLKLYMQTGQWSKAIAEGRELADPKYGYDLVTDKGAESSAYVNIFTHANEGNAETIWAVNCMDGFQTHKWFPHALPSGLDESPLGSYKGAWGGYKMMWDFFETFEPGDERTQAIISAYRSGDNYFDKDNKGTGGNSLADGVIPVKYKIENYVGENGATDWIVYRYADVLTLLAEAIVHNGNEVTAEAVDLLNRVRTRAGLPAYATADFGSAADFIDKLLWERAHELWYEGCRRQDLVRNNRYVSTMAKKCRDHGQPDLITAKGEKWHLFPLPESAIIEGQGAILQNPGY